MRYAPAMAPMRQLGRKRRLAGRVVLGFSVVLYALWIASGVWRVSFTRGSLSVNGSLWGYVDWIELDAPRFGPADVSFARRNSFAMPHMWPLYREASVPAVPYTPLRMVATWPLPVGCSIFGAMLFHSGTLARRRAAHRLCEKCGYDRRGLPAGSPCPECGKQAAAMASSAGPAEGGAG
jgi:hypothetical protein